MRRDLRGVLSRLDRLAEQVKVSDDPEPDPNDEMACLMWALRRYGLAALLVGSRSLITVRRAERGKADSAN